MCVLVGTSYGLISFYADTKMNYGYLFTEKLGTHILWFRGNISDERVDKWEADQHEMREAQTGK